MLYKLLINYVRIKLVGMVLNRIVGSKLVKGKKSKGLNMLTYGLELLATIYLNGKRKAK